MPASPLLLATEIVAPLSPLFLLSAAEDALEARADAYDRSLQSSPYASPHGSPKSRRAAGAGWVGTGITIANCLVGAGALGMPYALRMAGWAGLLVILSATLVTCFTAKCLVWCFNTVNARRSAYDAPITTYDELVQHCFGRAGAIAMKVATVVELFGGTVCMVVLHTVSWPSLLSLPPTLSWPPPLGEVDVRAVVAAAMCACALPTLLVNSRYLSLFAATTSSPAYVRLGGPGGGGGAREAAGGGVAQGAATAERDVSYVSVRSAGSAGSGGSGAPGVFLAWDGLQVSLKAGLLALAAFLAVSVPNFGYVVSLMGACTCMLMSFILPALCNLFVHWHVHTALLRALNVAVVGLGFAGMAIGLQATIARGA